MADQWREIPLQYHLYTNAYLTTMLRARDEQVEALRVPLYRKTILFRVSAPQLQKGQSLAVIGNHPAIGSWNVARYLKMEYIGRYEWLLSVNVDAVFLPLGRKAITARRRVCCHPIRCRFLTAQYSWPMVRRSD